MMCFACVSIGYHSRSIPWPVLLNTYLKFTKKRLCVHEEQNSPSVTNTPATSESHGSVAPYPPLRLVPRQSDLQLGNNQEQPLFS